MGVPASGMRYFFEPRSIAVVGASANPDKIGSVIFWNLRKNMEAGLLKASVYAVNRAQSQIRGLPCFPSVGSLPEPPELVVVAVPAESAVQTVEEAVDCGARAVIMIPGGFAETGRSGLQTKLLKRAKARGTRILGPNTIGVVDTLTGVDSLFLRETKELAGGGEVVSHLRPVRGGVVVITQSGHLGDTVAEELTARGVGVRALVGTGNQADVAVEDVIDYFATDDETSVIAAYIEGTSDGRRFIASAANASRRKPLVVFKVGKTGAGAKAALTHTASLAGDYEAWKAAFRQSGAVEARSLQELIDLCVSFSLRKRAGGKRLVILTNAGGVGAIAADEAHGLGLALPEPSRSTALKISHVFREAAFMANASLANPVDVTASASTEEFVKMASILAAQREYDMLLVMPTHQTPAVGSDIGERLCGALTDVRKPVAACVIGWTELAEKIRTDLAGHGIPSFPTPERAVRALAIAADWKPLQGMLRTARPKTESRLSLRRRLPEPLPYAEVERLCTAYGIRLPRSAVVRRQEEVASAASIGFPLVCKLLSSRLLHKTEAGGVILGIEDASALATAFRDLKRVASRKRLPFDGVLVQETVGPGVETILGGRRDSTFGPTVLFGAGGTNAELLKDYSLAIAPIDQRAARELVLGIRLSPLLTGYRGSPRADLVGLCRTVAAFSRIMAENPSIEDMEVNPLRVVKGASIAVDVRVLVRPAASTRA